MPVCSFRGFRRDPDNHPPKTASGKIEIYSTRIASYGYPVTVAGADDVRGTERRCGFNTGASGRPHTVPNHSSFTERYAVAGREPVTIHPDADIKRAVNRRWRYGTRLGNHRGRFGGRVVTDGIKCDLYSRRRIRTPNLPQAAYAKRRGKRPDKRSSQFPVVNVLCNTALEKYTGLATAYFGV